MNQDRRAKIEKLIDQVQTAAFDMREFYNELTSLQEEEQEAFDNLPEGLQQAERGQQMEAIACALDDALSSLDSAINDVESAASDVESALEQ
jgi:chromosome segregation ATPase